MRTSAILVCGLVVAMGAASQPYAPEYLPDPPWYVSPPPPAEPAPRTASSTSSTAGQRLVEDLRHLHAEEAASEDRVENRGEAAVPESLTTADYVRVFVWLCVIVAVIILTGAALRRWGKKSPLLAGTSLGKVLGRVYLDRNVSLHFVETAGQVLVIGVAQHHVALLTAYDKASFAGHDQERPQPISEAPPVNDFQRELQATAARLRGDARTVPADTDIQALQDDIARLQRQLREEAREFSE